MLDAPADVSPGEERPTVWRPEPDRSAVWALARAEGLRLLPSPLFLLATLGGVALFVAVTWRNAPTLQLDAILSGAALLPMAAGTFVVANLAAFRGHRHDTEELYEGLVLSRAGRTAGHLLSISWAAAAAIGVLALEGIYVAALRPTGAPGPFELITGPVTVALMGCAGVLLGRWVRSAVAAPAALVAIAAVWLFADLRTGGRAGSVRWLTPWVPAPVNPELLIRPSGVHLLYLLALIGLIASLALLRDGRGQGVRVVAVVTAVAVAISGAMAVRPPSVAAERALLSLVRNPLRYEDCAEFGNVEYCAYPGYRGWFRRWDAVVRSTLGPVPTAERPHDLVLRQVMTVPITNVFDSDLPAWYLDLVNKGGGAPIAGPVITPGTKWGRGRWEGASGLGLGLQVAAYTVGYPTSGDPGHVVGPCLADDQAKAIVAIWLAAQASPGSEAALRGAMAQDPWGIIVQQQTPGPGASGTSGYSYYGKVSFTIVELQNAVAGEARVNWGTKEATYALELLGKPRDQVVAILRDHWAELTEASTPTSRLLELFGLNPLPTLRQQLQRIGVAQADIERFLHGAAQEDGGAPACP
jgi:hypothetical protein